MAQPETHTAALLYCVLFIRLYCPSPPRQNLLWPVLAQNGIFFSTFSKIVIVSHCKTYLHSAVSVLEYGLLHELTFWYGLSVFL